MDTVPHKFVDSVVELLGRDTLDELAREVRHSLWKDVVDLHHRNRVYYKVQFQSYEDGTKRASITWNAYRFSMRTILKNRRFARINIIRDFTGACKFDKIEKLSEAVTEQLLETIIPLIDRSSGDFCSGAFGSPECTKLVLTSLLKRVCLQKIILRYYGPITYDFLEDQINNSPFLIDVQLYNWPLSSLDLINKFCLKGRPGKLVYVDLNFGGKTIIDSNYIQNLLDLWKANGNLHFQLSFTGGIVDKEGLRALMNKGQLMNKSSIWSFFKHETKKSIARVSNNGIECFTCECDKFMKCRLKECYPHHHDF
uniref:F-box domain-containing protein n=1 Tax=Steinernema glaseri TaxID=37863 RepID=A0A1I7YFN4_9BILA